MGTAGEGGLPQARKGSKGEAPSAMEGHRGGASPALRRSALCCAEYATGVRERKPSRKSR
jgi:hypothetical protein